MSLKPFFFLALGEVPVTDKSSLPTDRKSPMNVEKV